VIETVTLLAQRLLSASRWSDGERVLRTGVVAFEESFYSHLTELDRLEISRRHSVLYSMLALSLAAQGRDREAMVAADAGQGLMLSMGMEAADSPAGAGELSDTRRAYFAAEKSYLAAEGLESRREARIRLEDALRSYEQTANRKNFERLSVDMIESGLDPATAVVSLVAESQSTTALIWHREPKLPLCHCPGWRGLGWLTNSTKRCRARTSGSQA
jgi:hypothetical protein